MRIKKSDYIRINRSNLITRDLIIARDESHEGLSWEDTHPALGEDGLFMPNLSEFFRHYKQTIAAYNGKAQIYDGAGNLLPRDEVEEHYKKLTSDCWTHLNAKFVKPTSDHSFKFDVEFDRRVVLNGRTKEVSYKSSPLERYVLEDGVLVSLNFNAQGMPKTKSKLQEYELGKNIRFYIPIEGGVARFIANSVWAYLSCNGDSLGAYPGLGVRAVREI